MLELKKDTFSTEVHESKGVTVVDFWSQSCVPCKQLMPEVHKLADKYADKAKFCSFDIGEGRRVAMKEQVLGLPSIVIYIDGEKKEHLTGDGLKIEEIENTLLKYI
ncbi:MAG: thiol reductase thioredoxin [Treponema sp.]|nr:MAG: thiol reductase thioredoxin [Treponema sp.]